MMNLRIDILINDKITAIDATSTDIANLCIDKKIIEHPDRVYCISITSELIIVLSETAAFRGGAKFASEETVNKYPNTINAYDWNGNLQWNITDIVGDIKSHMVGGCLYTDDMLAKWCDTWVKGHDHYCCSDWVGRSYWIDLCDRKVIKVAITK